MSEVKIKVPSSYSSFTVGDELHIELLVIIQKPCKIKKIHIQFIGSEDLNQEKHIFLSESRVFIPFDSYSKEKRRESLFGLLVKTEKDFSKWIGNHSYKFKSRIPNITPSSLQLDNVFIHYTVSALVFFEDDKKREFTIHSNLNIPVIGRLIDEYSIQKYSNPFFHSEDRSFLFCSKQLGIQFNLNKLVFSTGDDIVTDIKLRNESSKNITRITFLLLQKIMIQGVSDEYVIVQKEFGGIKECSDFSQNFKYKLSESLLESIKKINIINGTVGNIIQISYRVKLRLEVRTAKTIRISVPILLMKSKRISLEHMPVMIPQKIENLPTYPQKQFEDDYSKIIDISIQNEIDNLFK